MNNDDIKEEDKSPLNNTNDLSLSDDQSIDWAKQAYLELKRKQKEKKELLMLFNGTLSSSLISLLFIIIVFVN